MVLTMTFFPGAMLPEKSVFVKLTTPFAVIAVSG
jgi:hypothetical protein